MSNKGVSITSGTIIRFILILLLLGFIYLIKNVLILFFIAVIIAATFDPLVDRLHRLKIPRALSIIAAYLFFFTLIGSCVFLLYGPIVEQIMDMARAFPEFYNHVTSSWRNISGLENLTTPQTIGNTIGSSIGGITKGLTVATSSIIGIVTSVFGGIVGFFLLLMMTFYLTVEERGVTKFICSFVPGEKRALVAQIITQIQTRLGSWLRGQIALSVIIFVMSYAALSLLGIKYALVLALLAGLFEIVPFLGPIISAVPAIFFGLAESWNMAMIVAVVYVVIQQLENQLIVPRVMGKATGLNPLLVLLVLLAGARVFGIVGALLAVPLTITISVLVENWREYKPSK
ncbi:MAG: hypothetical protein C3F02_04050 [Parcubacteria group bacterium]|nr:MAG: hypothetical protein C3F02_04050 [Parcubacteria group bacterium]